MYSSIIFTITSILSLMLLITVLVMQCMEMGIYEIF